MSKLKINGANVYIYIDNKDPEIRNAVTLFLVSIYKKYKKIADSYHVNFGESYLGEIITNIGIYDDNVICLTYTDLFGNPTYLYLTEKMVIDDGYIETFKEKCRKEAINDLVYNIEVNTNKVTRAITAIDLNLKQLKKLIC